MIKQFACFSLLAVCLAVSGCSHKGTSKVTTTVPPTTNDTGTVKTTPPTPPPSSDKEATNFIWTDVNFAYDDASLDDAARNILSSTGSYLSKHAQRVELQGHCDERGSVEYNLALGERRAKSVKDYLVSYGIPGGGLSTVSYGKERPLDPGHNEEAWAKNRRVHFVPQGSNQ